MKSIKFTFLFIFLIYVNGCSLRESNNRKLIGEWYAPNGILKITFAKNQKCDIKIIGSDKVEIYSWQRLNDTLLVWGKDTAIYKTDTIFFFNTYFTKTNEKYNVEISKDNFIDQNFLWVNSEDQSLFTQLSFKDDSTYSEVGSFSPDNTIKNWDLIRFENNNYLKIQPMKGSDSFIKLINKSDSTFKFLYYDFHDAKYIETFFKKK